MADPVKVELGAVQQTLSIPLAARARETRKKRPLFRDPKAAEIPALGSLGLEVVQEAAVTRLPSALRSRLPRSYRYALPLARPIVGDLATVTLFRSRPQPSP